MKRNLSIELVKFIFAISIALGHFSSPILDSGTVVSLFFALSGFFLVRSFDSGKYKTPWQYSAARIKRIYPYYIFAFLLFFTLGNAEYLLRPLQFFSRLFSQLPEIFLIQNVGVFDGGINYPLWQLSTLVVASHILYSLLMCNRQLTLNVICPVLAICCYTYMANITSETEIWSVIGGTVYVPLFRAVGGMALGMFVQDPIRHAVKKLEAGRSRRRDWLVSLAGLLSAAVFWLNRNSFAAAIPFFALIACMLYSGSIFARALRFPLLARLDKLSLAVYVNHAMVIRAFRALAKVPALAFLKSEWAFLAVLLAYCVAMLLFVDAILARIRRRAGKNPA